ncbi:DNA/RNA nuclease SfsA [Alteromonas flava]|uniref:DNA/RNA nuclease SfsA n=1 Tax=Alteromonas flava TaxID=2048003 RepID=UPI000C292A87|nr:DNA/RNA nuclease SfsA [Alteromonas flava]
MDFEAPLLPGKLLRRYKRFFADIELDSGELITAHCPNTGAMTGCAEAGFRAWVSPANNPKRKLQYTWELVEDKQGHRIGINTHRANKIVAESLANKSLPDFADFDHIRAEYKPQDANSRFDFLLRNSASQKECLVEIKSVTLADNGVGYFPDAVTSRGAKHCQELAQQLTAYSRCALVFCVQHTGITQVRPAAHIDPSYAQALREAVSAGLEVYAYQCYIDEQKIHINQKLSVDL